MQALQEFLQKEIGCLGLKYRLSKQPKYYNEETHQLKLEDFNKAALGIIETLHQKGFEAYLVGGCIRDWLSQMMPKDYDVVTNARPEEIKKIFRRSHVIGRRFRIVHVVVHGEVIEVCTFRGKETWLDYMMGRFLLKPGYSNNTYGGIETDALRRDFSINALYYDPRTRSIIDFTGGYDDIMQKRLVMIGSVKKRFHQDPVRILRAIRFSAKTGYEMEPELKNKVLTMAPILQTVSPDRLLVEVVKLFYQGHGHKSLELLESNSLMSILYPGYKTLKINKKPYLPFLTAAVSRADKRFHAGKNLSTTFLIAVLLWPIFIESLPDNVAKIKLHDYIKIGRKVRKEQSKVVSITKKMHDIIEDIWVLQYHMTFNKRVNKHRVVMHDRVRAAFDFLAIRAQVDEGLANIALKWHNTLL